MNITYTYLVAKANFLRPNFSFHYILPIILWQ